MLLWWTRSLSLCMTRVAKLHPGPIFWKLKTFINGSGCNTWRGQRCFFVLMTSNRSFPEDPAWDEEDHGHHLLLSLLFSTPSGARFVAFTDDNPIATYETKSPYVRLCVCLPVRLWAPQLGQQTLHILCLKLVPPHLRFEAVLRPKSRSKVSFTKLNRP